MQPLACATVYILATTRRTVWYHPGRRFPWVAFNIGLLYKLHQPAAIPRPQETLCVHWPILLSACLDCGARIQFVYLHDSETHGAVVVWPASLFPTVVPPSEQRLCDCMRWTRASFVGISRCSPPVSVSSRSLSPPSKPLGSTNPRLDESLLSRLLSDTAVPLLLDLSETPSRCSSRLPSQPASAHRFQLLLPALTCF